MAGSINNRAAGLIAISGKICREITESPSSIVCTEGQPMMVTVRAIEDGQVTIDGNHPLAGQVLNFKGSIVSIREASAEELDHGHVH